MDFFSARRDGGLLVIEGIVEHWRGGKEAIG